MKAKLKGPEGLFLLLAATRRELEPLLDRIRDLRRGGGSCPAWSGRWQEAPVLAAETGVGKANAAFALGRLLAELDVGAVFQCGCGGGYPQAGVAVEDVVVATKEVFADEGVLSEQGFLDLRQIGLPLANGEEPGSIYNELPLAPPSPPLPPGLDGSSAATRVALDGAAGASLWCGPVVTVSTCTGTRERADELYRRWSPLAEAMEGAAAALACRRQGLAFVEVRGISNLVGPRDRAAWRIDAACDNAARVLESVLAARARGL